MPYDSPRIAFIGLGRMGRPMCANLVQAGFDVVGVDPRGAAQREAEAEGIRCRPSLESTSAATDLVITMLPSTATLLEVAGDVMPSLPEGATWVDMGSNTPDLAERLGAVADAAGVTLLEAPVGGGPSEAEQGELSLYVGGPAAALAAHRPVLSVLAARDRIHHVGSRGQGYLAKLLVNQLWFSQVVAVTEALLLARRAGLDLTRLQQAMADSAIAGRFVDREVPALLRGDYLTTFGLADCVDELAAVSELAERLGTPSELSALVLRTHREALQAFGSVDGEMLAAALLEQRAGLVLH